MLWFNLLLSKNGVEWFKGHAIQKKYELLEFLFSVVAIEKLKFYTDLLKEITQIQNGELDVSEEMALADIPEWSSLLVYKDITVLELIERDGEHKRLEIPTSDFKQLIEDWIKFVEVNTAAFAKK